ncbi:hypothetical protein [Aminivibrio sp.]
MAGQADLEDRISEGPLDGEVLLEAKRFGLSDRRIACLSGRDGERR